MENTNDDTSNFLNWVEIKNFKSIKDLRLDCKRVNIFIGKPNVGKSNILEGLGMLGASSKSPFMKHTIRYEDMAHLFYDTDTENTIHIDADRTTIQLNKDQGNESQSHEYSFVRHESIETNGGLAIGGPTYAFTMYSNGGIKHESEFSESSTRIRKYDFRNLTQFDTSFSTYLLPPDGQNLYAVIRRNKDLREDFGRLFTEQKLELVFYDQKQELILQKKDGPFVWQYPYFSIADTFRRYMFYLAAIESNKNSVIVFEEPEVHSFPPYTQELAYRMIYDESNQYFISTHSPYMLHPFIEKMDYKDLNVFVTYYKDYQTHVRALTEEELTDILDFSTNVFFNLSRFEPHA